MTLTSSYRINDIRDKIMVKEPYFALHNAHVDQNGKAYAEVKNEYLYTHEGGPVGPGEFGRHLAILGSLALAQMYDYSQPHFFLSSFAEINRCHNEMYDDDQLFFYCEPVTYEKRKGEVYGHATDSQGNAIYFGKIQYVPVSRQVFHKLHGYYRVPGFDTNYLIHPYKYRKDLMHKTFIGGKASAIYGIVNKEECVGHFEDYPCLPVAVIGNLLTSLGMDLFLNTTSDEYDKAIVTSLKINATKMIFHGSFLIIDAYIKEKISPGYMTIYARADVDNQIVSDITFNVKGLKST